RPGGVSRETSHRITWLTFTRLGDPRGEGQAPPSRATHITPGERRPAGGAPPRSNPTGLRRSPRSSRARSCARTGSSRPSPPDLRTPTPVAQPPGRPPSEPPAWRRATRRCRASGGSGHRARSAQPGGCAPAPHREPALRNRRASADRRSRRCSPPRDHPRRPGRCPRRSRGCPAAARGSRRRPRPPRQDDLPTPRCSCWTWTRLRHDRRSFRLRGRGTISPKYGTRSPTPEHRGPYRLEWAPWSQRFFFFFFFPEPDCFCAGLVFPEPGCCGRWPGAGLARGAGFAPGAGAAPGSGPPPGAPAVVSSSSTVTVPPAFAAVPAAAADDDAAPWFWPLPGRTGFTPTLGARAFCSSRRTRAASSSPLAIFSNSRYCWPAVHRLLVTMYTRMAIGQNAPVTRMPTGNAHSISWFMILACGLAAAWGDWRDREIRAFTWVVTAET